MFDDEMQDFTVVICVSYFFPTFFILFLRNCVFEKTTRGSITGGKIAFAMREGRTGDQ